MAYHYNYHSNIPMNTDGPYQYNKKQLQLQRAKELRDAPIVKNPYKGVKYLEPEHVIKVEIEEEIKVETISKKEFKRLEREDIMNEWQNLINEYEKEKELTF